MSWRESQRNRTPPSAITDREGERESTEEREPLFAELGLGLRDDQPSERLCPPYELNGLRGSDEPSLLARRREHDDDELVAIELGAPERAARQPGEPEALSGEQRGADVVELVAGRELELLGCELGRLGALVGRPERGLCVQRGESSRLTTELVDGLLARHVLEQTDRESDRDEPEHEDDGEEECGETEPERPEHESRLTL